jgi:cysteine desulfurase/selenocysteine lyase
MSTSDLRNFPVTPEPEGSLDFLSGGVLDPRILARMANEFFSALPAADSATGSAPAFTPPVDPSIGIPLTAPVPATLPAASPEVSLPSDPRFPSAPTSAGLASTTPLTAPALSSPPAVPGAAASSLSSGSFPSFSFLQDARPLFGEPDVAPSPYPEAKPITEFVSAEQPPVGDASATHPSIPDSKSPPPATDFAQPPAPAVPGAFGPVGSSAVPAFSFLEEARPLFSSTPSIPGPVPAQLKAEEPWLKTGATGESASSDASLLAPFASPFGFAGESRSITSPESATVAEPLGIEPNVADQLNLSSYSFDAEALRRDFPILRERVNGRPLVWLDNAATTQKPQSVIDRLNYFYEHENSNVHRAAHELAARATDAYESAREKVRRFLNASSSREIVFVRGATEGINLIAQSWGRQNIQKDDEIVITWLEHHANIVPWQMLCTEKGAHLRVAPVDSTGQVLLDEYEKLLGPRTRLVAFTQVSNALGVVTPAQAIIEAGHRHGAKLLLDGAQSVSHMRVDVQSLDCDFFVFSGHKVFAPTGIGVVYAKPEVLEYMPPWQGGGNMIQDVTFEKTIYQAAPQRFEAGTGNIADAVGLGAAIDYVHRAGMENIARHEHRLLLHATDGLQQIPGLRIIGTAKEKAGVISFVMDGFRTEEIGNYLNRNGIAVRSGHHCAQPILRRFGLESTVRASLALYNTLEDVDALVRALWNLRLGRFSIE